VGRPLKPDRAAIILQFQAWLRMKLLLLNGIRPQEKDIGHRMSQIPLVCGHNFV